MQHPRITQFTLYKIRKPPRVIHTPITQEIRLSHSLRSRKTAIHRLHHISHINKRNLLRAIPHSKIHMPLNTLSHNKIIPLTRSIHPRRTQYYIRKRPHVQRTQKLLSSQFTPTISRIRPRRIRSKDRLINRLPLTNSIPPTISRITHLHSPLPDSPEDTQRRNKDKPLRHHTTLHQSRHQIHRTQSIRPIKIIHIQTLRSPRSMHHIIPATSTQLHLQSHKLPPKHLHVPQIQTSKPDTLIRQIATRTRPPHTSPHLEPPLNTLADNITTDEATSSSHQNTFHRLQYHSIRYKTNHKDNKKYNIPSTTHPL